MVCRARGTCGCATLTSRAADLDLKGGLEDTDGNSSTAVESDWIDSEMYETGAGPSIAVGGAGASSDYPSSGIAGAATTSRHVQGAQATLPSGAHLSLSCRSQRPLTRKAPGDTIETFASAGKLRTYCAALCSLQKRQHLKASYPHTYPSARTKEARRLEKVLERGRQTRERELHFDRGANTLFDGYTTDKELESILTAFIETNNSPAGVRNAAMWALSHSGMLRGDNVRALELADLGLCTSVHHGKTVQAVTMLMRRTKTNKTAKALATGFVRHRCHELDSVFLLALHFFVTYVFRHIVHQCFSS